MVKKIAISSGKGGVGKSMLTANLALFFAQKYNIVAVDSDVDAPNLSLWLGEENKWSDKETISTKKKPQVHNDKCDDRCSKCPEQCQFKAMSWENNELKVNRFLCEGCGACQYFCPDGVIEMKPVNNGEIKIKTTQKGFPLVVGQLFPGETGSGEVVTKVKEKGSELLTEEDDLMLIDSSPGTGCSVIAALRDVDFVVLITEPTPSAYEDLRKVLEVVDHFNIPFGVVINKADLNSKLTTKIKKDYQDNFLGKIGYEEKVYELVSNFQPIFESDLEIKKDIKNIFNQITNKLWSDPKRKEK